MKLKKFILILVILLFAGSAIAAEICFNVTAANDTRAGKQATRKGITKSELARRSLLNAMDYNTAIRQQDVLFTHMTAICNTYECDD